MIPKASLKQADFYESYNVIQKNIELLDQLKAHVSIDVESMQFLMLFKNFRNLSRVVLRPDVDFTVLTTDFPNLKHIDHIEVRRNSENAFEEIKSLIKLSPNEVNFERIHLKSEQLYEMLKITSTLTVERAVFKLIQTYEKETETYIKQEIDKDKIIKLIKGNTYLRNL